MITDQLVSGTARRLTDIMADLQKRPQIEKVVLCTVDGLTVNGRAGEISQISAVGGFIMSAADFSSNLLGHKDCQEVTVEFADNAFMVCKLFVAGNARLILAVLFHQKTAYKRLLSQIIIDIREAMEQ